MKNLFLAVLAILIAFSQFMVHFLPSSKSTAAMRVIYWVTDANPARREQVALFHGWLRARGVSNLMLKVDVNNADLAKTILQGVTGIAGDIIDTSTPYFPYLEQVGLMTPVKNFEAISGYPDREMSPAVADSLTNEGGQIAFPCGLRTGSMLVNLDAFTSRGLPPPPFSMDFDTFEKWGKEFDRVANAGKARRQNFLCQGLNLDGMRRTLGIATFNETMTACALNQPGTVEVFKRYQKWVEEDHLLPTEAEQQSWVTDQGYGRFGYQLLFRGQFAMLDTGRHAFIQMRAMKGNPQWAAILPPWGRKPVSIANARASFLYAGSKKKQEALLFLSFLRSEEYNLHVVRDSDGLPPSTKYMNHPEFLRPAGHTNEWKAHEAFGRMATDFHYPMDFSPFALNQKVVAAENQVMAKFRNHLVDPEQAACDLEKSINEEIRLFLARRPEMMGPYLQAKRQQAEIDRCRGEGRKIPLALVSNPFLKKWYRATGEGE